jgi:hypothetical protein
VFVAAHHGVILHDRHPLANGADDGALCRWQVRDSVVLSLPGPFTISRGGSLHAQG